MAKSQKRSRSTLLAEILEAHLNRRSALEGDERIFAKLDRIDRTLERINSETFVISHSLSRFIRHQLIYAAALPVPGDDAKALGEKQYQAFLDMVARVMADASTAQDGPPPDTKVRAH
jgi:hypothetical protein